ncbi:heme-binding protein [uncultured Paraglaciecola sp.]|uniref:SOUL family heme-binding protein n=1 Tax=uncultured Paraglaciecola sp. TaxID=1765024 RepID=UPI0030DB9976|tara:strand:- start:18134 stop:18784 length:651 start_codon:yes stop_codon:yes gene_type:complete
MTSVSTKFASVFLAIFMGGCSVVGENGVASAPYTLLESDDSQKIQVRNYASMVWVSTSMSEDSGNSAFRKLFAYIGGENEGAAEIAMTAPVIMDDNKMLKKGTEIPMTAPVFMNDSAPENTGGVMSFVMPNDFTLQTTPKPTNEDVKVSEVKNYKVAVIEFSGTLSDNNVQKYTQRLTNWIDAHGYTATSQAIKAGYNGPFTIPMFRKNEVLIEVK